MATGSKLSKKIVRPQTNPLLLRQAMARRLQRRAVASGRITMPAVPGMLEQYIEICAAIFGALGRPFAPNELEHARKLFAEKLAEAYRGSPRSNIVITYDAPVGTVLHYEVAAEIWTVAEAYDNWVATRTPPLFGTHPDARVMALAEELEDPKSSPVLDIGAGTGRNALALARRGHPVDAVEMTPKFVELLLAEAATEKLELRVVQRNIFQAAGELGRDYRLILLSEVVSDFRNTDDLRGLFELAAEALAVGGVMVFNVHIPVQGYTPDRAAREWSQQSYSMYFSLGELAQAKRDLPLELVGNDSVYEFEKEHLGPDVWPPTGWYAEWVSGQDLYDLERERCPIEMRWLVYRKTQPYTRAAAGQAQGTGDPVAPAPQAP
jgi:SAM-dependent methyltransferase